MEWMTLNFWPLICIWKLKCILTIIPSVPNHMPVNPNRRRETKTTQLSHNNAMLHKILTNRKFCGVCVCVAVCWFHSFGIFTPLIKNMKMLDLNEWRFCDVNRFWTFFSSLTLCESDAIPKCHLFIVNLKVRCYEVINRSTTIRSVGKRSVCERQFQINVI